MQSTIESRQAFYEKLLKFPAFYTIQQHQETRKKQLVYWGEILLNFFKKNNVINSSVSQIMNFPIIQERSTAVSKKLTRDEIIMILNSLQALGSIQWKQGTQSILILHFSAFQFADQIYRWAKENFLINDVETIDFISNGKNTGKHQKFYNQPKQIIIKAINVLEKQGKAQLIDMGGGDFSAKFI